MWHYLMVYDRRRGEIILSHAYRRSDEALEARFTAERKYSGQSDIEVVVLSAKSRAALLRTHGRYFKDAQGLAEAALERVES